MEAQRITSGDVDCTVRIDGPDTRHAVLLLPDATHALSAYDELCSRLHNSGLRTAVVESVAGLGEKAVPTILSELTLPPMVNLVGCGAGADLAWLAAAASFERFTSLVVVGRGHPAIADLPNCRPVEVATTVLVTSDEQKQWANRSSQYVYGDFRVVSVAAADIVAEAPGQLATEIVLRTSLW